MNSTRESWGTLSLGAHLRAEDGACLMEAVSQWAHEPWSDSPGCTHPLVAHLVRLVNDASTPAGRQMLIAFVPALADSRSSDPATYPCVALACTNLALAYHPSLLHTHLNLLAHAQLRREQARSAGRLWRRLYQHGPAHRAVEVAVAATRNSANRDHLLRDLLVAGLNASRTETPSADAGEAVRLLPSTPVHLERPC